MAWTPQDHIQSIPSSHPSNHFTFLTYAKSFLAMDKSPLRDFPSHDLQNLPFTTCYRHLKGHVSSQEARKACVPWQKFCETFHFQWINISEGRSAASEYCPLAPTWRYITVVWFATNPSIESAELAGLLAWKVVWKICTTTVKDETKR